MIRGPYQVEVVDNGDKRLRLDFELGLAGIFIFLLRLGRV